MEIITLGLFFVYLIASWYFLSVFQSSTGIVFFGCLSDYFLLKLIVVFLLGWAIIPIGLIVLLAKAR